MYGAFSVKKKPIRIGFGTGPGPVPEPELARPGPVPVPQILEPGSGLLGFKKGSPM